MRLHILAALSLIVLSGTALCAPASEEVSAPAAVAEPDSHAEVADALVDLLQRTLTTLEQCTDAASVNAALPTLQAQREEAEALIARQAALPEPTIQDYMAAQARANDFLDAKRAIRAHIERLQAEGLMTDKIRRILGIAPETAEAGK